jgi:hypothetical protein
MEATEGKKKYSLLTPGMEVNSADAPLALVEADVVEALEAGAIDCPHAVVRDQKVLLPPHENIVLGRQVGHCNMDSLPYYLGIRTERGELVPVADVCLLSRTPGRVIRDKAVARSNDLALKVRGECWVVFREAYL